MVHTPNRFLYAHLNDKIKCICWFANVKIYIKLIKWSTTSMHKILPLGDNCVHVEDFWKSESRTQWPTDAGCKLYYFFYHRKPFPYPQVIFIRV